MDPDTMVIDNGWVIEYDMEVAKFCPVSGRDEVMDDGEDEEITEQRLEGGI